MVLSYLPVAHLLFVAGEVRAAKGQGEMSWVPLALFTYINFRGSVKRSGDEERRHSKVHLVIQLILRS